MSNKTGNEGGKKSKLEKALKSIEVNDRGIYVDPKALKVIDKHRKSIRPFSS